MFKPILNASLATLAVVIGASQAYSAGGPISPQIFQVANGDTSESVTYYYEGNKYTLKPGTSNYHASLLKYTPVTLDAQSGDSKFTPKTGYLDAEHQNLVVYYNYNQVVTYVVPK